MEPIKKSHVGGWTALGAVVGIVIYLLVSPSSKKQVDEIAATPTSRDVALTCTTDMATQYHIHPELKIIINGVDTVIPANIGIQPTCMTSIHTHDAIGTIHVEAPVARDFTLGDFFAVWKKDFSKDKILDQVVTNPASLTVTVNGVAVDTYENTILRDKDKIVIMYQEK